MCLDIRTRIRLACSRIADGRAPATGKPSPASARLLWGGYIDRYIEIRGNGSPGFEGMRPYALRHTFATLNLANGENIKTVSVLMGHASSAYTLGLCAAYVPGAGIGIGRRYMGFLRVAV